VIECRAEPRIPVELPVSFSTIGTPGPRKGTMFDLSAGGCAVTSATPVGPGTGVTLQIRAIELGVSITIHSAAVRWANHGEFGVEFLTLTELDRSRLRRLLQVAASQSSPRH
jgi:hypothetical protein